MEKEYALQDLHIERINLTRLKEEWLAEKRKMTRLLKESRQEILRDRGELELQRKFFETSQEEQGLALSKEKAQIQVGTQNDWVPALSEEGYSLTPTIDDDKNREGSLFERAEAFRVESRGSARKDSIGGDGQEGARDVKDRT